MTSGELFDLFRSDVGDQARPYLWGDPEVYAYLNDAYFQFVRLTGGIADFTSPATQVDITAGEATSPLNPAILRIMDAGRASDGAEIKIINSTDVVWMKNDYGAPRQISFDNTPGEVRYMLIGGQRNFARWVQAPVANDVAVLTIYRLPLKKIVDADHKLDEIGEEHHLHLIKWMKHLAHQKQDAETFDRARSAENGQFFRDYCSQARAEAERYKHKTRIVAYGGI